MGRALFLASLLLGLALTGCGLRTNDQRATVAVGPTTNVVASVHPSTTGAPVAPTAPPAASATGAAAAGGPFDLIAYCGAARAIDLTDLSRLVVFTPATADDLYRRFSALVDLAPVELESSLALMQPVFEEGKARIDSGEIASADAFGTWLRGLIAAEDPLVKNWIIGHQTVVPWNQSHCA